MSDSRPTSGIQRRMATKVSVPATATARKATRHDSIAQINVPSGTPTSVATAMPPIMYDTAATSRPGAARRRATMAPTPKYAPWGSPDITRAANRYQYPGASAAKRLPAAITAAKASMSVRRRTLRTNSSAGAPQHTPSA